MTPVRRLARPLLAAPVALKSWQTFRQPRQTAEAHRNLVDMATSQLGVNVSAETVVKVASAASLAASGLFALGKAPRLAAGIMTTTSLATTLAENPFWKKHGKERTDALVDALGSVGLLGGLLLATVDTDGKPGLAWRAGRALEDGQSGAKQTIKSARREMKLAQAEAKAQRAETAKALRAANKRLRKHGEDQIEALQDAIS